MSFPEYRSDSFLDERPPSGMRLAKAVAVYTAPLSIPLALVAICRIVVWSAGVPWTQDIGGGVAAAAMFFAAPAGAGVIVMAHVEGWIK